MKINQLQIEPHIVKPDTTEEYYGNKEGFVLWKTWVDGNLLTETARPFKSSDSIIELKTNIQFPVWFDGDWYVSVRRIDDYIIWYSNLENIPYYKPWDKGDKTFLFDTKHYEMACKTANKASEDLKLTLPDFGGKSPQSAQILHPKELGFLLMLKLPDSYDVIYREPSNTSDATGKRIFQRIEYALKEITEITEITTCNPPDTKIELRIGLDETPFTEAIWHIGKVNGKFAIYFEQHPYFPVWLQSPAFDKVLHQEPFSQDI